MSRAVIILFTILACTLYGQFFKTLLQFVGLPNLTTLLKDMLIFGLFLFGLGQKEALQSRKLLLAYALFLIFFASYIFISMLEDRHIVGLYYARLYYLPIMFFIGCQYTFGQADKATIAIILKWAIRLNFITVLLAFALYALVLQNDLMRATFLGSGTLANSWYLGGAGHHIIRMGLPFSSPNSLGSVLAMSASVVLTLLVWRIRQNEKIKGLIVLLALDMIALTLTFSRSAMLLFLIASLVLFATPGVANRKLFNKAIFILVLVATMGTLSLYVANEITYGMLERWLILNLKLSDPSLGGHSRSITDAIDNIGKYYLYGYERGTVGPKAEMFTGIFNNVENSFLGMLYDFGIFCFFLFFIGYSLLIAHGYKNRFQYSLLIGFGINIQILPIIFEPEVIIYFLFLYLLIGKINPPSSSKTLFHHQEKSILAQS